MSVSYSKIGKNIAAERSKAGLTQEELAERLGISTSHLSNIERAQRTISISMLVKICEELAIPLERLLRGAIYDVAYRENAEAVNSEERMVRDIIDIVNQCDLKTQKCIFDMCVLIANLEKHE